MKAAQRRVMWGRMWFIVFFFFGLASETRENGGYYFFYWSWTVMPDWERSRVVITSRLILQMR